MPTIEFKDICVQVKDKPILSNFSLLVEPGDKVQIIGKSGIGKSTLLRLLLGFQEYDSGELIVDNNVVQDGDFKTIRQYCSYVNQDVTLRRGIVREVLEDIARFSHNDFDGELDSELLAYFEFDPELLDSPIEKLSGGERQRLGILIAIELNRDVFLLDEITSGLDQELKQKTVEYFHDTDKTVITISHDLIWQEVGSFKKVVL